MRIVEGFPSAKAILTRQAPSKLYESDSEQVVRQIIADVRDRGDKALFEYTSKFDGVKLTSLKVNKEQIAGAYEQVDAELVSALKLAAERISVFHIRQKESLLRESTEQGSGWMIHPLDRVGIYAPGGTAPLSSSLLMTVIPAKVAGVSEIIVVTPPGAGGVVSPATLIAADIAEVDRIFSVGGAQAITALAFGTKSIPKVDKICGPGNSFVVLAKKMVYGVVGIDALQGPSEILIIADETANPEYCAADLLAQAEHDPLASAILITTSRQLADKVSQEVKQQLKDLPRQAIANESFENQGMIVTVDSMAEAIELANLYAPEHVCLMVDRATAYVDQLRNAGCIFVGENSVVVLGDYVAGPSHVLPTEGTARFSSPLNVSDFIKLSNLITVDDTSLKELGQAALTMARAEGLEAHARAVEKRLKAKR